METHYEAPKLDKDAFTCPHCNAYSAMRWEFLMTRVDSLPLKRAVCHRCKEFSLWRTTMSENGLVGNMIDPDTLTAPLPSGDLPVNCLPDYLEAREISNKSPRGAAALLRLCIQNLCVELGGKGKNINDDIATLVSNGLPQRVQQALDVVRVVGNNSVHPGEMTVQDQPETVAALFSLVNLIVDNQITQPKQVSDLFETLPDGAKKKKKGSSLLLTFKVYMCYKIIHVQTVTHRISRSLVPCDESWQEKGKYLPQPGRF